MAADERRAHGRIETDLSCGIATADASHEGTIANLSMGGAALLAAVGIAQAGDSVGLSIEPPEPFSPMVLTAEVLRVEEQQGQGLYRVRFSPMAPTDRESLVELLRALARGRGQGKRQHARIEHRLDLICRTPVEFRATLRDISRGGLALACGHAMALGTKVEAVMGFEDQPGLARFSGTVVHVQELGPGQFRTGVRFEAMTEDRQRHLDALIDILLGLGPRQGVVVEEDDDADDGEGGEPG